MNRIKNMLIAGALVGALVFAFSEWSTARVDKNTRLRAKLRKADIVDLVKVGYNNWNYVMRNQGSYFFDAPNGNPGGEFPRGSGNTIVFAAGLYVGTLKNGVPVVSETEFSPEFQPGHIENSGVPFVELTAEDPTRADLQVYLIDRSASGSDYSNWPNDAPKNSFGLPALIADAQTWAVFNDLDVTLSQEGTSISPDPGLGLEVVLESFAFNAGPLSDVVYCKFTILNKTNVDYADSYLGMWMDADVDANNATNDIVGVDTVRGLGFVYNADDADFPGAVGFDFLQGPVVDTTTVHAKLVDKFRNNRVTLIYDPVENRYIPTTLPGNQIWLGATSFNTYANGTDPQDNAQRYNLLAGLFADGNPKTGTGVSDYYAFRGDPVTGLPAADVATALDAADQRILHGVGPFIIDAGSSQEVWVGVVGAQGTDRLNAIVNMRTTDDLAQTTFEAGLIAPVPPDVPKVKVVPLDGRVVVTWDNSSELSEDIAGEILGISTANGYTADYVKNDFQGYRVYTSRTGLPGSFTLLADYDLNDGITSVVNQTLNTAGTLEIEEVLVGTDNGLRYRFDDNNVINGQTYFYSVTAYDAQPFIGNNNNPYTHPQFGTIPGPSGLPISLETAPTSNVVSVVPMVATLGSAFDASTANVQQVVGVSDGVVELDVVNPDLVTGDSYRIENFYYPDSVNGRNLVSNVTPGTKAFQVRNLTTNSLETFTNRIDDPETFVDINSNGQFDPGEEWDDALFDFVSDPNDATTRSFGFVDGLQIGMTDASGIKSVAYVPGSIFTGLGKADTLWYSGPGGLIYGVGEVEFTEDFWGATALNPEDRKDVDVVFSRNPSEWSVVYTHGQGSGASINDTSLAPFRMYEVDPLDGDAIPRQLNVNWRDRFTYDAWTPDGGNSGFSGTTAGLFSYTYAMTSDYDGGTTSFASLAGHPALAFPTYFLYWFGFNIDNIEAQNLHQMYVTALDGSSPGGAAITFQERFDIFSNWPDNGTLQVRTNHVIDADHYTFATTRNTTATGKKTLKESLRAIRAVPNPYYGQSLYQTQGLFGKVLKFTNLPGSCTIRIFNVAGDLVTTLVHNASSTNGRLNTNPLDINATAAPKETSEEWWNLTNTGGKFVASGMYIALIDVPGVGKKTVKFAVIQEANITNGPEVR